MSLSEEVGKGRLPGLIALRDALAAEIEAGKGQTAQLGKLLSEVLRQIEDIERAQPKGSFVDELAKRRRSAAGVEVAERGGVVGS